MNNIHQELLFLLLKETWQAREGRNWAAVELLLTFNKPIYSNYCIFYVLFNNYSPKAK